MLKSLQEVWSEWKGLLKVRRTADIIRIKIKSNRAKEGRNTMIRKMQTTDTDRVAEIWLDTNLKAHDFIPPEYWKGNYDAVKEMISQAEVYVYIDEDKNQIQGFIGLDEDYIAGIFVWGEAQSRGIGRRLLDRAKEDRRKLTLNVYARNPGAVRFYQREGFRITEEDVDRDTGEAEYLMCWEQVHIDL